jgi:hypothetical protein
MEASSETADFREGIDFKEHLETAFVANIQGVDRIFHKSCIYNYQMRKVAQINLNSTCGKSVWNL